MTNLKNMFVFGQSELNRYFTGYEFTHHHQTWTVYSSVIIQINWTVFVKYIFMKVMHGFVFFFLFFFLNPWLKVCSEPLVMTNHVYALCLGLCYLVFLQMDSLGSHKIRPCCKCAIDSYCLLSQFFQLLDVGCDERVQIVQNVLYWQCRQQKT